MSSLDDLFPSRSQFLMPIEQVFNKFYDDLLNDKNLTTFVKSKSGYPKLDIYTMDDKWIIDCACPGLKNEDVIVEIVPDEKTGSRFLKITGSSVTQKTNAQYYIKELTKNSFERVIRIPDNVKGDPIASLKDGILSLIFELSVVKNQKKLIEVK